MNEVILDIKDEQIIEMMKTGNIENDEHNDHKLNSKVIIKWVNYLIYLIWISCNNLTV